MILNRMLRVCFNSCIVSLFTATGAFAVENIPPQLKTKRMRLKVSNLERKLWTYLGLKSEWKRIKHRKSLIRC